MSCARNCGSGYHQIVVGTMVRFKKSKRKNSTAGSSTASLADFSKAKTRAASKASPKATSKAKGAKKKKNTKPDSKAAPKQSKVLEEKKNDDSGKRHCGFHFLMYI